MSHATPHYVRKGKPSQKSQPKTIASTVGGICKLDKANQRCGRDTQRQTKIGADSTLANGFLNTSFLPKLKAEQSTEASTGISKKQNDFYHSLDNLAHHYGIQPMHTQAFDYPYNLALALWDAQTKLKDKVVNWDAIAVIEDKNKICFLSEERYNTGTSLYYVPVIPLYRMLKDRKRRKTAQLLLSVCTYLYHHAQIPYYRQENSYLHWQYEMLKEWMEDDDQDQDYTKGFYQAECIGDCMEQKIFNLSNLTYFKERLSTFKSSDEFDKDCYKLAKEAFEIFTKYPNESAFRNAGNYEENEQEQEVITMAKCISFWATGKGSLSQNLTDTINNEFNEYSETEQPTIQKKFTGSSALMDNLDFENRLFPLLDELCYLLSNY